MAIRLFRTHGFRLAFAAILAALLALETVCAEWKVTPKGEVSTTIPAVISLAEYAKFFPLNSKVRKYGIREAKY